MGWNGVVHGTVSSSSLLQIQVVMQLPAESIMLLNVFPMMPENVMALVDCHQKKFIWPDQHPVLA